MATIDFNTTAVPTNPRTLATEPGFPSLELLDALERQIGEPEARKVWNDALKARGDRPRDFESELATLIASQRGGHADGEPAA
jgi:hypothetical protein